jgi:ABC-2 type transport system permease protein
MSKVIHYAWLVTRLNLRNRMAMIYGYLFPLAFLLAFAVIYRHDPQPLTAHLGKLLAVTALGGACFGLPTSIVAERERGIWRRYRASPQAAGTFVFGQVISRLMLLISAAAIQLVVAVLLAGMPTPPHPLALGLVFVVVAMTLISIGMIIAMLANSVPAVQALGQCVFLPLLMIGGIALPIESLPVWTQFLSSFFPGRFAVAALQSATTEGLASTGGDLVILGAYAVAGGLVAGGLFRWDITARQIDRRLLVPGLALWLVVGAAAGLVDRSRPNPQVDTAPVAQPTSFLRTTPPAHATDRPPEDVSATADPPAVVPSPLPRPLATGPASWEEVGEVEFASIAFERLPADSGLIAPLAERGATRDDTVDAQLAQIREALPAWLPAKALDPVERVRNLLYVAAVPDLLQMDPLERHLPWLVFDRLRQEIPPADLARILYWIAMHPQDEAQDAITALGQLGLPEVTGPTGRVRERAMLYALKFLQRLEEQRLSTVRE